MVLSLSLLKNLGEMFPLSQTHFSDLWHMNFMGFEFYPWESFGKGCAILIIVLLLQQ